MGAAFLEGKETILVVSPQPWSGFQVSKHHYAIELAALGNLVYFMDPPQGEGLRRGSVAVDRIEGHGRMFRIKYRYWFPEYTKFRCKAIYDWCMCHQARRILQQIDVAPTIVWDFDNTYCFNDLRVFGARWRIFHPVDVVMKGRHGGKHAHFVYSVASRILEEIKAGVPTKVIAHGLGREHEAFAIRRRAMMEAECLGSPRRGIKVGYVGNLVRRSIDRAALLAVVGTHREVEFHFFGPTDAAGDTSAEEFIAALQVSENCRLHGLCSQAEILQCADDIDAWLVCYEEKMDPNGGIDTHKMLEYFATGRVVVSSFIESYKATELVVMCERGQNRKYPEVFARAMSELPMHNCSERILRRTQFALQHCYRVHLQAIQQHMNSMSAAS